jgi:hypothetical protein
MSNKQNLLWILFFGSLIGLNESFLGNFNMPYRAVILSSITLTLLSIARLKINKTGTSVFIILIAVLFKINNIGYHSCTTHMFLCGPTAVLLLGIGYEVFATSFSSNSKINYLRLLLICGITSIVAFSLFGIMNTYILKTWDVDMLTHYVFVNGLLTAIASSGLSILCLYIERTFKNENITKFNPYVINSILSCITVGLWVFGSLVKF